MCSHSRDEGRTALPALPLPQALARGQARLTVTGLEIEQALEREDWLGLGEYLARMQMATERVESALRWALYDWLTYGEERIFTQGIGYEEVAQRIGLSRQTLANIVSVGRRYAREERFPDLPFSIHAEFAYLPAERRHRALQLARQQRLTTAAARELRRLLGGEPPSGEAPSSESPDGDSPPSGTLAAQHERARGRALEALHGALRALQSVPHRMWAELLMELVLQLNMTRPQLAGELVLRLLEVDTAGQGTQ